MNRVPPLKTISQETNFHVDLDKKNCYPGSMEHKNKIRIAIMNKISLIETKSQEELQNSIEISHRLRQRRLELGIKPPRKRKLSKHVWMAKKVEYGNKRRSRDEKRDENTKAWLDKKIENSKNFVMPSNLNLRASDRTVLHLLRWQDEQIEKIGPYKIDGKAQWNKPRRLKNGIPGYRYTQKDWGEKCGGMCEKTVHRTFKRLEKMGLIHYEVIKGRKCISETLACLAVTRDVIQSVLEPFEDKPNKFAKKVAEKLSEIKKQKMSVHIESFSDINYVNKWDKYHIDNNNALISFDETGNPYINANCRNWQSENGHITTNQIYFALQQAINLCIPEGQRLDGHTNRKIMRHMGIIRNKLAKTPESLLSLVKKIILMIRNSLYLQGKKASEKTKQFFKWSWSKVSFFMINRIIHGFYVDYKKTKSKVAYDVEKSIKKALHSVKVFFKNREIRKAERLLKAKERMTFDRAMAQIERLNESEECKQLRRCIAEKMGTDSYYSWFRGVTVTKGDKRFALTANSKFVLDALYDKLQQLEYVKGINHFSIEEGQIIAYVDKIDEITNHIENALEPVRTHRNMGVWYDRTVETTDC